MNQKKHDFMRIVIVIVEVIAGFGVAFGTNHILTSRNTDLVNQISSKNVTNSRHYFSNSNLLGVKDGDIVFANKVTKYLDKKNFKGTITVYQNKKLILQRGYGFLNKSAGLYYDYTTAFPMYKTQRSLNTLLLLDLANSKNISIKSSKAYISGLKKDFSIKELLLDRSNFLIKNTNIKNSKELNSIKKNMYIKNKGTNNDVVIAYLIQRFSGMKYEKYLQKFFNKYIDLNYLNNNDVNDINRLVNKREDSYGTANISVDSQSFAVIQGLLKETIRNNNLSFGDIIKQCFATRITSSLFLNRELNAVNISLYSNNGPSFVIQTDNDHSTKYYSRISKELIKIGNKYLS